MCKQKDSEGLGNRCLPGYSEVTVRLRETLATDPGGRSETFLGRARPPRRVICRWRRQFLHRCQHYPFKIAAADVAGIRGAKRFAFVQNQRFGVFRPERCSCLPAGIRMSRSNLFDNRLSQCLFLCASEISR